MSSLPSQIVSKHRSQLLATSVFFTLHSIDIYCLKNKNQLIVGLNVIKNEFFHTNYASFTVTLKGYCKILKAL